jgi:hypothetical protein
MSLQNHQYRRFLLAVTGIIFLTSVINIIAMAFVTMTATSPVLYSVDKFRDFPKEELSINSLADHLSTEVMSSPSSGNLLQIIAIAIFITMGLAFVFSLVTVIKNRRNYSWVKSVGLVFVVGLQICIWFFVWIYSFQIAEMIMIQIAKQKISGVTTKPDSALFSTDEILSKIKANNEPVTIVVGYRSNGVSIPLLTNTNNETFFDKLVIPSTLSLYANETLVDKQWNESPIWYFPEDHTLVITDLTKISPVLQDIVIDLMGDRNPEQYAKQLNELKKLDSYQIVDANKYTQYYIQKVNDSNNKTKKLLEDNLQSNLNVITECSNAISSNKEVLRKDEEDYQKNCIEREFYNNCSVFLGNIGKFKAEMLDVENECAHEVKLAYEYNKDITKSIDDINNSQEKYEDPESVDRKIAELSAGVFISPSSIYLRNTEDQYELFRVALHEYIHYSVSSENRNLPEFFDEGMTDYIVGNSLGYDDFYKVADAGYFAETQIILALLEKIPLNELMSVYISGDNAKFEELFNKYFNTMIYADFEKQGDEIFKTSYAVEGKQFEYDPFSARDYVHINIVENIRTQLGLDERFDYYKDN